MTEYDHPFDLDEMGRDPTDEELDSLDLHQIMELYRDLAEGGGTVDAYDRVTNEIVRRVDEYEAEDLLGFIVDGRFTHEGVSVSVYDQAGRVIDETWFTWSEVEGEKAENTEDGTSAFTFELEVGE